MAGFFDIFKGSGNNFYFRDAKNANRFRPDANPVRQKFQGYVNFIFNRDLFEELYSDGTADRQFRTTIGSLVRTAELPSVTFETEVINSYNRKRIVQTGVKYDPISMTVYDTVGNEWLTVLMKYFSYHYMNPRNKGEEFDRDLNSSRRENDQLELINSNFGSTEVWDSNLAGFNLNNTQHFFERIDFVLYHGTQGVQYSIFNPVLTGFKPSEIDYSDNVGFRDFQLSFEYESFTTYNRFNFGLSNEDLSRFEDLSDFKNIKTFQAGTKAYTLSETPEGDKIAYLGIKTPTLQRFRSIQPQFSPGTTEASDGNSDGSEEDGFSTPRQIYGSPFVFASPANTIYTGNPFVDTLINVADAGLSAAINGGDIRDAALGAALSSVTRPETLASIGNTLFGSSKVSETSPNQPPATDSDGNAPLPPGT